MYKRLTIDLEPSSDRTGYRSMPNFTLSINGHRAVFASPNNSNEVIGHVVKELIKAMDESWASGEKNESRSIKIPV